MPGSAEAVVQQLADRRLSSRDKRLRDQLSDAPADPIQDEMSPGNVQELARALDRAKDPHTRAILQRELDRIKDLARNLMPMKPQASEFLPGYNRMPYTPQANERPGLLPNAAPLPQQRYTDTPQMPFLPGNIPGVNGMPFKPEEPVLMYPNNGQGVVRG